MNKITLVFLIVCTQTIFGYTKITQTEKLAATCKVWGFLKYYHPTVASGKINWDEKLFEVLPKIEKAQTKEEFSVVIEKWIESLGEVPANTPVAVDPKTDYFNKNLNLEWTQKDKLFSKSLSQKLKFITENRFQGVNYYVNQEGKNVRLQFVNEPEYADFKWTDKNLRLLALFRFWNYIEYFFPYKYVMDQNWDEALMEILPHIDTPASEKEFLLAMREISIKLNDTHAGTTSPDMIKYLGGEKYIPFTAKFINDKAVIVAIANDSLAKIDDLKIGDIITKVGGSTVAQQLAELSKYMQGSNKAVATYLGGFIMFTGDTDDLEIEFIRDNVTSTKKIHRYPNEKIKRSPPKKTAKWEIMADNIGFVRMSKVPKEEVVKMMEELKGTQAIIFDARSRPINTDFLVSEYLNPERKPILRLLQQDLSYPGRYYFRNDMEECGKSNPDYYKGKVVVLVGSGTHSFGEQTVMSLQTAPNVTIVGTQTSGSDGPNYEFSIINGFESSFTSMGVFYPNKKETQRIGIVPDIKVIPTVLGAQQGKDEVFDRALLFVKTGK
ncbi:S41 family peptidase [Flavobacterium collinsii]|uniref:TSPc domain-containing protein n=1 Tax=Flavobacterium collinsii TaxID=1114861 RepID=A0A9W4TG17_9FLAO|nr:S41 family peptidase [Flavobacterium collinsii]CAI2766253.1 TSPc domain-containing protein [Flavobacterium collinsii]